ncbi:MAG: molybdate ABC transporter substrate-binding protein [Desulfobacterales bacterium]|nr:molybdate ABC transporter substrate-binding protein [Desulfobacterales bacterium]
MHPSTTPHPFGKTLLAVLMATVIIWPVWSYPDEIVVSAASSLTQSLTTAGQDFQAAHPEVKLVFNFAASGALLQQIAQGAPVDVFASADRDFMDRAEKQKLIRPATRRNFARNTLVLALPAGAKARTLADFNADAGMRLAIGDPESVPAGRYARQALQINGLWTSIGDRLILANSVTQMIDYLRRGEIDAAIVFGTDVRAAAGGLRSTQTLATADTIVYCIAVTADSRVPDTAQGFIAYLLGELGQDILSGFGFERP